MRILSRFLGFFFRHLYTTFAWSYDLVAWIVSVGQWRAWSHTAIDPLPTGLTLELGHGPGHLLLELAMHRVPAIGVDLSMQMARMADRRLRRAGAAARVVRADAKALPFAQGRFQAIVSSFPPEFAFDQETASECWRVLQVGSSLTLVLSATITGNMLLDRLAAALFRVTNQSAEVQDIWLKPYREMGFEIQRQDRSLPRARVARVIACKS